jgi:hypothetical protein
VTPDNGRFQYKKVAVSSTVETLDGQRIGVIAEIRGQMFKIKTPRFQRDYWLRVDYVRSSAPDASVILNVPKAQLDEIKVVDPQLQ